MLNTLSFYVVVNNITIYTHTHTDRTAETETDSHCKETDIYNRRKKKLRHEIFLHFAKKKVTPTNKI